MMEILTILIPVSLLLGGIGLAAFIWAMRSRQFDDPAGDANRILIGQWDSKPMPRSVPEAAPEAVKEPASAPQPSHHLPGSPAR